MVSMPSFFRNEMRCLSNAVLQSCIRHRVLTTYGLLPLVRKMVEDNHIPVGHVLRVEMYQQPDTHGIIWYRVCLTLVDGRFFEQTFQGSGFRGDFEHFLLYDQERDGKVEYLRLVH